MKQLKIFLYFIGIFGMLIFLDSCAEHTKHTYTNKITDEVYLKQAASCTSAAVYYYSCGCGEIGAVTFKHGDPLGHSFTSYTSYGNATCDTDGTETAQCDRCAAFDTRVEEGSALGHLFTDYVSNNDATCGADGTETAQCDRCTATNTKADEGSMLPHPYSDTLSMNETHHWYSATCTHSLKKDEEKHTYVDKICTICHYPKPEALIESIKDAEINGTQISLLTKSSSISEIVSSIICSEGASYLIYIDAECNGELPSGFSLKNGDNTLYIKVTARDAEQSRVYTMNIYKSFSATVTFKDDNGVLKTVTHDTGYLFTTDYIAENKTGYTFDGWLLNGNRFTPQIIYGNITLDAAYKGNEYKITLDADGGILPSYEITVVYGEKFSLPIPSKGSLTFVGWQDESGKTYTSGVWQTDKNIKLTAKWEEASPGIQLPSIPI